MSKVVQMVFGGGSSSSNQQATQQSGLDPRLFDLYNQNVNRATGVADNLQARQIAGFGADYNAGADVARQTVLGGQGLNTVGRGASLASMAGMYRPQNVNATNVAAAQGDRGDIRDVRGGSFLNANIGAYMNPFLQNVAGNVVSDLDRARQMEQMKTASAAAQASAFGGSRQGVLEAETNRNFYDRLGNTLSSLYSTGFDTASSLAGQDLDRRFQAQLANQGMDANLLGLNVGNEQAARLANQDAQLRAALANQGAGLTANEQRLAAAGLLGQLGTTQQQLGLQGADALVNLGLGEQRLQQERLDAQRNLDLERQAIINEALGLNPAGGSGMTSSGQSSGSSQADQYKGIFNPISLSDIRVKQNIERVGALPNGLGLYSFEYKPEYQDHPLAGRGRHVGVLAQEVEMVIPGAVVELSNGIKAVDYAQLG
jgi:hypothetical protein